MASLAQTVILARYRFALQEYLARVDFAFDSVAGRIIEERLPARYAGDPIRPLLVLWSCAACGDDLTDALPVAAAFDLFDRFMLLHDELTDEGAESIARWGLGQSLNAGDALYAVAFRSLANDVVNARRRLHAARIVAQAVLSSIGERCANVKGDAALTGAALQAGAVIAGASAEVCEALALAGRTLDASPLQSAELVRPFVGDDAFSEYLEVARYIARRNA
jgi:geranylgeranyl pyrophosphate synthase